VQVLRADRETLLSVLETFVHDPLVDWTRSSRAEAQEAENPHAKDALATIAGARRRQFFEMQISLRRTCRAKSASSLVLQHSEAEAPSACPVGLSGGANECREDHAW